MDYSDNVNGVIVGGDYIRAWVTYEGRRQGNFVWAESQEEAIKQCREIWEEIKKDCGAVYRDIYPRDDWRFNFD